MTEIETFLCGKFHIAECNSAGVDARLDSVNGEHVVSTSSSADSSTSTSTVGVTPKALKNTTPHSSAKKGSCDIDLLKVQISVLKELVTDKNNEVKKIMSSLTEKDSVIKNLD